MISPNFSAITQCTQEYLQDDKKSTHKFSSNVLKVFLNNLFDNY